MKTLKLCIIFFLVAFSVSAQFDYGDYWGYSLGYQKESTAGGTVPKEYHALRTFELSSALESGQRYSVHIDIRLRMPKGLRNYEFDFWLFESDSTGRTSMNTKTIRSKTLLPRLTLDSTERNIYATKNLIFFTIPKKSSTHLTVGLKKEVDGVSNILDYVKVRDVYLKYYPKEKSTCNCNRKEIATGKDISVTDDTITIYTYDHRRIDGDIITLYLNNTIVLEKQKLKRKKKKIEVQLKPGKNTLLLYAENLGDVPPNTAAIEVVTKEKTYQKVLKADLKQSEYLTIYYKPEKNK